MNDKKDAFVPGETGAGRSRGKNEFKKSEITRERILMAARKVFAEHPYKAASIRMIGKAGGFDHPLIHYYFPTKAELFEAVVAAICEDFYEANKSWFEGLGTMKPRDGLSLFIDRFLEYNFKNPEPLKTIVLNLGQVNRLDEIPGYQLIPGLLSRIMETFQEKVNLKASPEQISMFIHSFNNLGINYLGANTCHAEVLGMDPRSEEYREWVKDTLMFIFLPLLVRMIFPERFERPGRESPRISN